MLCPPRSSTQTLAPIDEQINGEEPPGELQSIAAKVLMKILDAALHGAI